MKNDLFESNGTFIGNYNGRNVAVLDREETKANAAVKTAEELEAAKLRMKRNLDKLLNYDVYEEEQLTASQKEEEEVAASQNNALEEDIRPTATTMQFGTDEVDQMREEMKTDKEENVSYKLNLKGKIAITVYSIVVAVIMALIIINTGVLASLSGINASKAEELNVLKAEYISKTEEIASISNDEYVLEQANILNEQLKLK